MTTGGDAITQTAELQASIKREVGRWPKLTREYDRVWDAFVKKPDRPVTPEELRKVDQASHQLHASHAAVTYHKQQIDRIANPTPQDLYKLEQEEAKRQRLEELREMATATKKKTDNTDVPAVYLKTEGGPFKPGLDARYKSDLIASVLGETSDKALSRFNAEEALKRLQQRGWQAFLDKSRAARAAKEERKLAAAAKAKKTVAAKRSTAKVQARDKAEAAIAAPAAEAPVEAKPDPKPEKRVRAGRGVRGR